MINFRAHLWEDKFRELMPKIKMQFKHLDVYWYSSLTNDIELVSTILYVIPYFTITVIIMIIFSTTTSMMRDWVQSKPLLGAVGVVSASLSTAAAFGLVMYIGVEFIGLVMASPFLMLGETYSDSIKLCNQFRVRILAGNKQHCLEVTRHLLAFYCVSTVTCKNRN
jgi:predicted RND superfamily exporter protein